MATDQMTDVDYRLTQERVIRIAQTVQTMLGHADLEAFQARIADAKRCVESSYAIVAAVHMSNRDINDGLERLSALDRMASALQLLALGLDAFFKNVADRESFMRQFGEISTTRAVTVSAPQSVGGDFHAE